MTLAEIIGVTAGGARWALTMLALMVLYLYWHTPVSDDRIERFRIRASWKFALAAVIFSPAQALFLMGHAMPVVLARTINLMATLLGCLAFIDIIASRAVQRGVPMARVRRACMANGAIIAGFIAGSWILR